MLLAAFILIGGAVFAVVIYKQHLAEGIDAPSGRQEAFKTERASSTNDGDDEIVEVAAAYRRVKGKSPSTGDVKRVMKAMRRTGDSAADVIKREAERDRADEAYEADEEDRLRGSRADVHDDEATDDEATDDDEPADDDLARRTMPKPEAPLKRTKPRSPSPALDAMDYSMLRRVEDELESMVNRIDGLLEEIQSMKGRTVSGPLSEDTVESFVPYHPV